MKFNIIIFILVPYLILSSTKEFPKGLKGINDLLTTPTGETLSNAVGAKNMLKGINTANSILNSPIGDALSSAVGQDNVQKGVDIANKILNTSPNEAISSVIGSANAQNIQKGINSLINKNSGSNDEDDVKKPIQSNYQTRVDYTKEDEIRKNYQTRVDYTKEDEIRKNYRTNQEFTKEAKLYESIANNLFKEIPEDERYIIKCDVDAEEKVEDELELQLGNAVYKNSRRDVTDKWTPKEFGMGESSYFFDLLEDTVKDPIVAEFKSMYELALNAVPFSNCSEALFQKKNNAAGVTYCQVERIFKEWQWNSKDTAYDTFQKFDLDFNGVLSPREFILMAIETNKNTFEETHLKCTNCFLNSQKLIKNIYEEIDYCQNGKVTSKEIWKVLKFFKNKENHNIYKCPILNYRSPSVNDFVLKSNAVNNVGYLSRGQFTRGILLGFWNRQIRGDYIVDDDTFSRINERWIQGEDFICNKIYKERNKNQ